ncbi:MAG: HAMP domain-containing sensor histidine kinase [Lentisphaeria bacterium]|nr:HAMP domain-containing sensor histidine kinase [Lentisphaeria bacterium]
MNGHKTTPAALRRRLLFTLVLLASLSAALAGALGLWMASVSLERRLVRASSDNLAGIVGKLRLPVSAQLMANLRDVSGCELAVTSVGQVSVSTLADIDAVELSEALAAAPRRVTLQGERYRVSWSWLDEASQQRLWLLLPQTKLRQALREQTLGIGVITALAALLAVGAGVWLAAAYQGLMARLAEADRRLARAESLALAGKISAAVVHELRNPLSGIKMNAQVLAEEQREASGEDNECLALIVQEVDRIDLYLRGLSDLSSSPAGQGGDIGEAGASGDLGASSSASTPLAEALESLRALLAGRCRHAGVELSVEVPAACRPLRLACPAGDLRRVLLNVVNNALEAVPTGGAIAVSCCQRDAHSVDVAVRDNGPGVQIAPGEDIFAPFTSSKSHGCGIGLHLCKEIVTRHGGGIRWENNTAGGACFVLTLPLATDDPKD